eukprot:4711165-Ditylum_brightwellii.AAC.1
MMHAIPLTRSSLTGSGLPDNCHAVFPFSPSKMQTPPEPHPTCQGPLGLAIEWDDVEWLLHRVLLNCHQ